MLLLSELTEARVEHIERHPVALLSASDCDETLVAVVLWFINLNHAATDLTDLVDLLAALADDRANHVIGNVDLLGERTRTPRTTRTTGTTGDGRAVGTGGAVGASRTSWVRLHVWSGSSVPSSSVAAIGHLNGGIRVGLMRVAILRRILLGRYVVATRIRTTAVVVLAVAVVARSRLRVVGNHLQATRHSAGWAAAARCVSGGGGTTETVIELL